MIEVSGAGAVTLTNGSGSAMLVTRGYRRHLRRSQSLGYSLFSNFARALLNSNAVLWIGIVLMPIRIRIRLSIVLPIRIRILFYGLHMFEIRNILYLCQVTIFHLSHQCHRVIFLSILPVFWTEFWNILKKGYIFFLFPLQNFSYALFSPRQN